MLYKIDDIAPTISSVTGNATELTNENVKLVVNATDLEAESAVLNAVKAEGKVCKVKSRNYAAGHLDMIIEVRVGEEAKLVKNVSEIESVTSVSLISHDGEVTF